MIRICAELDKRGYYKAADMLMRRYIESQFVQPSNNANWPIDMRMVPYQDDIMRQRDRDWLTKSPSLSPKEYIALPGMNEPALYPSDGGTSNIKPLKTKQIDYKLLKKLIEIYKTKSLTVEDRKMILDQINRLTSKLKGSSAAVGSSFDMQGTDDVPGPRNAIIDHSSPSMVGLDGFSWKQRKDVYNNPDDQYKQLLPL